MTAISLFSQSLFALPLSEAIAGTAEAGFTAREEVEERRLPVVQFLLEHGYDLEARDVQHKATALGWAEHSGAERIAALLRAR